MGWGIRKGGCAGCHFVSKGGLCNYHWMMGVTRAKLGVERRPEGGCDLYRRKKRKSRARESDKHPT